MKIYENGVIRDMTEEEVTAMQEAQARAEAEEKRRPLSLKVGFKFIHNGELYKTIPAVHTFGAQWVPGVGTESLYVRIDETHDGTKYDPIPYSGNMALYAGKYYAQDGVTYLCNRDTGNPVYHALSELVGLYVEVVNG